MKPDYQNWVPKPMVTALWAGTALAMILFILFSVTDVFLNGTARFVCALVLGVGTFVLLFFSVWMTLLYRTFDYNGKRKMAKTIIDGTAGHIHISDGGVGLDRHC